ncbi:MAG: hypothetical protein M3O50_08455 [Myxococcota bacterium]|nr:hypothetical protein [Myxococcota bacterium]
MADAAVVYMAILRDAPISGPLMRLNAAGVAREFAVASYLDAKATEAGLLTELGATLAERASFHRQRAERLSVTTHALSQRARGKRRGKSFVEQATAEIAAEKNNAD